MRLATFRTPGTNPRIGAVVDDTVIDLAMAARTAGTTLPASASEFLALGAVAWQIAAQAINAGGRETTDRVPLDSVELLPPVPDPSKIVCVGRNYLDHATEVGVQAPEQAVLFLRLPQAMVGHRQPVWLPRVSPQLDWEGELAVVIGRTARHVSAADAYSVVAGYSIFNDISVRDFQQHSAQYTAGKNFEATGPFGPVLVSRDEIPDPHDLVVETFVDGERMQHGYTGDMIFRIPRLIAEISQWTTLRPGDVIATGTPAGVGGTRTPPRFLTVGSSVTVRISGIGELTNPIIDEPSASGYEALGAAVTA